MTPIGTLLDRKHFIEIARQINAQRMSVTGVAFPAMETLDKLSEALADSFENNRKTRPYFHRARFLHACGVTGSPVARREEALNRELLERVARMAYERAEEARDAEAIARYNARKVSK